MNRSNVGNVITNGMQILSVGATTAGGVFRQGREETALNNIKLQQQRIALNKKKIQSYDKEAQIKQGIEEEKLKQQQLKTKGQEIKTQGEQWSADKKKVQYYKSLNSVSKKNRQTIDEIMEGRPIVPQTMPTIEKMTGDFDWQELRKQGKEIDVQETIKEIIGGNK